MKTLLLLQIRLHSRLSSRRGQTMTEYALILGAVAVVAYAGYRTMGRTMLNTILDEIREELG